MTDRIIFVYPGDITGGTLDHVAASNRVRNLAKIMRMANIDVVLVGLDKKVDDHSSTIIELDGFETYIFGTSGEARSFFSDSLLLESSLRPIIKNKKANKICFYGTTLRYSPAIIKLAKQFDLETVAIVNEWGNKKMQPLFNYLLQRAGIRYARNNYNKIITISTMMEKYFHHKSSLRTLRIPSVFDTSTYERSIRAYINNLSVKKNGVITISYAGSIKNNKDYTANVVIAISKLSEVEMSRIKFNIYGSDEEQLCNALIELDAVDAIAKTQNSVHFKGFLSNPDLLLEIYKSDYTILVRPNQPYANAGFPTKFGESMTLGVPVIANLTSDLGLYLKHDLNGIVVKDESVESIVRALRHILEHHETTNRLMRENAHKTGQRYFDINSYIESMSKFLYE